MNVFLQLEVLAEDAPIDGPGATSSSPSCPRPACSRFAGHLLLHLLFVLIKGAVGGFCFQQCYVFRVVVCARVFVLLFRRSASVPFSGRACRRARCFLARASSRAFVVVVVVAVVVVLVVVCCGCLLFVVCWVDSGRGLGRVSPYMR